MKTMFLEHETWWGGCSDDGSKMPLTANTRYSTNLRDGGLDQSSPLFISSEGRVIYSKKSFSISFADGVIEAHGESEVLIEDGLKDLKGAYQFAAQKLFFHNSPVPQEEFFTSPQFNTWIELKYNQNQHQILEYAESIVNNGITPGILMIDEGWAEDYGVYDFYPVRFPDPESMMDRLHELGFRVMLWVTPYISPDSNTFRELRETDYLLRDKDGKFAIREWWNGFSCSLDLTNPSAAVWFQSKLDHLMTEYHIDGFKFDGADAYFYRSTDSSFHPQCAVDYTTTFDSFAANYSYNELRAVWNMGGSNLVCRLQDKRHSWDDHGIKVIVANMLTQNMLGYHYGCPDMIGGGELGSFNSDGFHFDSELYIRWMEASILLPMIQFSVAPWRVLNQDEFQIIKDLLKLRAQFVPYILQLARQASETHEPIVRPLEYEFPHCGYSEESNQFMLGDRYLVAPCLEKGASSMDIHLPKGLWKTASGELVYGGKHSVFECKLGTLLVFERME